MVRSPPAISSTIKGVKLINNAILRYELMIKNSFIFAPKRAKSKREHLAKIKVRLGTAGLVYSASPHLKALATASESVILAHTKLLAQTDNHVARY